LPRNSAGSLLQEMGINRRRMHCRLKIRRKQK
jgi:hypothetical protein